MEGIETLELLEINNGDKKIRLYLPKFSDVLNSLLTKEDVEALIQQRQDAKQAKDYIEADRIRNGLKDKGVILVDHKDRATTWDTERYYSEETRVFRLEFKIPKRIATNTTYLSHQHIELHSNPKYGRSVLIDLEKIANDFHLATNFVLYIRDEEHSLVNTWDDTIKTMIVHREFSEDDDVVFWYRD